MRSRASPMPRGAASEQTSLSRVLTHAATLGVPVLGRRRLPRCRFLGPDTAAQKAIGRFMQTHARCCAIARRTVCRSVTCSRPLWGGFTKTAYLYEVLEAERTIEAQGRIENLAGAPRGCL